MNEQPKIGILCNSSLGLPSLQALLHNKLVTAIGVADKQHEAIQDIRTIAQQFNLIPATFTKKQLSELLAGWVSNNKLDVVFVFTFPWKIPGEVLSLPPLGFINFHFGLLPQFRGADAIFPTIKSRAPYGGITVHEMDADYDTGAIIHIEKIPVLPTDTYGMHSAKLANTNISVLQKILPAILSGKTHKSEQPDENANYYSRPAIKDISILWQKHTAEDIVALVNACNPWNKGSYTMLNGMPLRITEAKLVDKNGSNANAGEIIAINDSGLIVQCIGNKNLIIK